MNSSLFISIKQKIAALQTRKAKAESWQSAPVTLEIFLPQSWSKNTSTGLAEGSTSATIAEPIAWCLRKNNLVVEQGNVDTLGKLKEQARGANIIAWAPANAVLLTSLQMPTTRRKRIEQALPYAMEDIILGDPSNQHFVYSPGTDSGLSIAVVNKVLIGEWKQVFEQAGLYVRAVLPLPLGLPYGDSSAVLAKDADCCCLRTSESKGLSVPCSDNNTLLTSLKSALSSTESPITRLNVYNFDETTEWENWHSALDLEIRSGNQPLVNLLHPRHCSLNLLQGQYSIQPAETTTPLYRLRSAAVMAGIAIAALFVLQAGDAYRLKQESNRIQQEMLSLFRTTFPDAKVIVDPVLQMQQKFNELRGGGGDAFLGLLMKVTPVLTGGDHVTISSISYGGADLTINLTVKDYAALDTLKQRANAASIKLEVLSANRVENKVSGRIKLSHG
ncbi:MAG: type II secretion system protein GspL [Gammaproteobacteria bacterium]|nr:type II secretion system protein GspL [Gammaproteobacteria bacterium]